MTPQAVKLRPAPKGPQPYPSWSAADTANMAILLFCALALAFLRWKKIDTLLMFDTPRWLNESMRLARGELPYRDFSWMYPPFSIFLMGWAVRVFGLSFTVVQIVLDILSGAIVFLSYLVMRYFLPPVLRLVSVALVLIVCATNVTAYSLFSMLIYTPAILTATVGLLIFLFGALRYLRHAGRGSLNQALIAAGSFISLLSKPESALAVVASLVLLLLLDSQRAASGNRAARLLRYVFLLGLSIGPALVLYAYIGARVGYFNLKSGIGGYGVASLTCPWWPTGLGVCTMIAVLGEALCVSAGLSLLRHRAFSSVLGRRLKWFWTAGAAGGMTYIAWLCFEQRGLLLSDMAPLRKAAALIPATLWANALMMPLMWIAVLSCLFLLTRLLWRPSLDTPGELLMVLTIVTVMACRSLFGHVLSIFPTVPAMCYPFLLLFAPYLAWRILNIPESVTGLQFPGPSTSLLVSGLVLAYLCVRLIAVYPTTLSYKPFRELRTQAGAVRLADYDVNSRVYRYVLEHSAPNDMVLDIPYGGGINFAAGRPNPLFDTQFWQIPIPDAYQARDLQELTERPPKIVIAKDAEDYGTFWGVRGNVLCACPRLVWAPDRPSWKPGSIFPAVQFIKSHYHLQTKIGDRLLLVPNDNR